MSKNLSLPFLPGFPASTLSPAPNGTGIISELVAYENRHGQRIVGFHDFPKGLSRDRPWTVVLPGYGETKTDVISVSYFLAKNGFHTLRFDYSDHVGESDGEIVRTTLTKLKDDILSAVDFLFRRHRPSAVGVVGSSLACRALLRAAREDDRIALLINLVSVVDLRKTLGAIYQEDYLGHTLEGRSNGIMDVLGFQVDADNFLRSAIQDRYDSLQTTVEDVREIRVPAVFFAANRDAWVDLEDVREVFEATHSRQKNLHVLQAAMHKLYENPAVAKEALKKTVEYAGRYLPDHRKCFAVHEPDLREIGARIRKEKERNRLLHEVTQEEEREFWKSYLEKYAFIINVHDYWNLLEFVYRLLREPTPGERILDAGCGIGNYGTFLLFKLIYQLRQSLLPASTCPLFSYVGLDFVRDAVFQAKDTHSRIETEYMSGMGFSQENPPATYSYFHADLGTRLPFKGRSFDKICCNLVISYLRDPGRAVSDMVRLLKPKGRLVITSLKPFADLSQVYRNYVRVAESEQQIDEARKLLSNAGRVMAKEAEGIYQFFSEEELTDLLRKAGISDVETYRSFGNQANVAVGVKR